MFVGLVFSPNALISNEIFMLIVNKLNWIPQIQSGLSTAILASWFPCLYFNPQVFSVLLFLFSPPSCWMMGGSGWLVGHLAASRGHPGTGCYYKYQFTDRTSNTQPSSPNEEYQQQGKWAPEGIFLYYHPSSKTFRCKSPHSFSYIYYCYQ